VHRIIWKICVLQTGKRLSIPVRFDYASHVLCALQLKGKQTIIWTFHIHFRGNSSLVLWNLVLLCSH